MPKNKCTSGTPILDYTSTILHPHCSQNRPLKVSAKAKADSKRQTEGPEKKIGWVLSEKK